MTSRVLVADDDPFLRKILRDRLAKAGYLVDTATDGAEALELATSADIVLLDLQMPRVDGLVVLESLALSESPPIVIVITAHGDVTKAVAAMKAGAWDFVEKPFDGEKIEHVVRLADERRRLQRTVSELRREVGRHHVWVRGNHPAMRKVASLVERVAPTEATVLLTGETGTGKEVVARALHQASSRSDGPFVAVNCAALPRDLLESELFGHEKGAFTGATAQRPGRIEAAAGGTLFLDEVAELDGDLQAKLLRVLQEHEFHRVGSNRAIRADIRIVAATNRELPDAVRDGSFRADLYYRLKVIEIELPPLRERGDDIVLLAECFLEHHARQLGRTTPRLDADARRALLEYSWPGNVRELANVMQRCAILAPDTIAVEDLPEDLVAISTDAPRSVEDLFDRPYIEAVQRARILIVEEALRREDGHQTRAAERLGLSQPYLSRVMKKLGISS